MKDPFARSRVATARAQLEGARLGQENIRNGGSQEERIALSGDLKQAQLAHDQAEKNFASLKKLEQEGAASTAEVDSAQERVNTTGATLQTLMNRTHSRFSESDKANAAVHVADAQAAMDAAKIQFENANIASTIGGIAYSIKVRDYDFVPMGADLVRVADLNHIQIRAYFDEPEIGKLIAGQAVAITWDGRPGRTWHGHIKRAPVAATVMGPRSVGECTITVDDSKSELLPNTNVMVRVLLARHAHVLTLPRAALQTERGATFVYRVVADHLVKTPVRVGLTNLDRFEVLSGVSQGDVVAWRAVENHDLTDGLLVRASD
jgi:HlyD family secretion protein